MPAIFSFRLKIIGGLLGVTPTRREEIADSVTCGACELVVVAHPAKKHVVSTPIPMAMRKIIVIPCGLFMVPPYPFPTASLRMMSRPPCQSIHMDSITAFPGLQADV
jgi:hypothetical protein